MFPFTVAVSKLVMAPKAVPTSPLYTEAPLLATPPELVNITKLDRLLKFIMLSPVGNFSAPCPKEIAPNVVNNRPVTILLAPATAAP